ncbi:MAG: hypothetical protein ACR2JW_18935 [Thermomicrobiales bacterium]
MQKFWHIPVYPRPRRVTATSLPVWDEHDPNERVMIQSDENLRTLMPAWTFTIASLLGFFLLVALFGYVLK